MTDSAWNISTVELADRTQIFALWQEFMQAQNVLEPRFTLTDNAETRWHNDFHFWVNHNDFYFLKITSEQKIFGYLLGMRYFLPVMQKQTPAAYIQELYVTPEFRQKGSGKALVNDFKIWAKTQNATEIHLGILANNLYAISFWEHLHAHPFSINAIIELN